MAHSISFAKGLAFSLLLMSSPLFSVQAFDQNNVSTRSAQTAQKSEENIKFHGKTFCIFKSFGRKSKCPIVQFFNPTLNEFTTLYCGTRSDNNQESSYVARSTDLQNLGVLNAKTLAFESGSLINKKYPGFRESILGKGFESLLMTAGIISSEAYKGNPLFDELNTGAGLWWVTTVEDFSNVRIYLERLLGESTFSSGKIHVLLDIVDGNLDALPEEDLIFINKHFVLVDPEDQNSKISAFFKEKIKDLGKMASKKSSDFKESKESWGEQFLRLIEADGHVEGFNVTKLSTKAAKYLLVTAITVNSYDPLKRFIDNKLNLNLFNRQNQQAQRS